MTDVGDEDYAGLTDCHRLISIDRVLIDIKRLRRLLAMTTRDFDRRVTRRPPKPPEPAKLVAEDRVCPECGLRCCRTGVRKSRTRDTCDP